MCQRWRRRRRNSLHSYLARHLRLDRIDSLSLFYKSVYTRSRRTAPYQPAISTRKHAPSFLLFSAASARFTLFSPSRARTFRLLILMLIDRARPIPHPPSLSLFCHEDDDDLHGATRVTHSSVLSETRALHASSRGDNKSTFI